MRCSTSMNFKPIGSCGPGVKGAVKTVYIDAESYKKIGMIEAVTNDGRPVVIDNSIPDIDKVVPKAMVPISNPYPDSKSLQDQFERNKAWHLQEQELTAADLPEDTKKLIAAEYKRLKRLHPTWKPSKAARKAGEKYNVKFMFE
jgi:hypothetical protein